MNAESSGCQAPHYTLSFPFHQSRQSMQTGQLHADALIGRLGGHETPSVVRSLIVKKPLGLRPPATSCRCHPGGVSPEIAIAIEIEIAIAIEIEIVGAVATRCPRGQVCNSVRTSCRCHPALLLCMWALGNILQGGWHWQLVASVAQQQLGFGHFSMAQARLIRRLEQMLAIRLLLVPSVSGSESGSGSIPLECHRNDSVTETIDPADIRDRFTVHNVSRVQIPSFVLRFRFRYRPRPRL
jgi:hypothetical protein